MTKTATTGLLIALFGVGLACTDSTFESSFDAFRVELMQGDTVRLFEYQRPAAADTAQSLPLLFVFHGAGGTGPNIRGVTGFDWLAEEFGFIAVYPTALLPVWAEDCGCSSADLAGVNDTGFVRLMIDTLSALYPIDHQRIYATGFSQGGFFTYRLACQMTETFAAVAAVGGPMSAPVAASCDPPVPLPVLNMQGTDDIAVPYEGGGQGAREILSARATAEKWAELNGCPMDPTTTVGEESIIDGTRVIEDVYAPCDDGSEVLLYTIEHGNHQWYMSQEFHTTRQLALFLLQYVR